MRILIRSNSPDEDMNSRFPGRYVSEHLWHKDREYASTLIGKVTESYSEPVFRLRRKQLGFPELGMCLLIMEPVTNTPGEFDATYSGCFSDIGELALLTFTNPHEGLNAMMSKPIKHHYIDVSGDIKGDYNAKEQDLARRLRHLASSIPIKEGKGWEIEFVENNCGTHVVQTTPIVKSKRIEIPQNIENIFNVLAIVGTGKVVTGGLLYVPPIPRLEDLVKFDLTHSNYALVTVHNNISIFESSPYILKYVENPSVIIDITNKFFRGHPFATHVEQYMREGRVALSGKFTGILSEKLIEDDEWNRRSGKDKLGLSYSPTKLFVATDEVSQKGIVHLVDTLHNFKPVK